MLSLIPIMKALGRAAAVVMAVLLAISSAPLYVCAQSVAPPCMPKMAHTACNDGGSASLACCCNPKDAATQTPAIDATATTALQPLEGRSFAAVFSDSLDAGFTEVTPQPYRNCDLPTLFSTFLL